ncbi:capsular polysaccharide synthesis protein [Lactobacillus delbrueckii]|uniref:capsular polysaccharide synthesis protein n=1 Tax=Lactobacillus delbrueckii TaxID=1584 RepID=UPI0012F8709F|nr:capsular polysaccharide synthesis protein [Lactobacillus delbrueckii]
MKQLIVDKFKYNYLKKYTQILGKFDKLYPLPGAYKRLHEKTLKCLKQDLDVVDGYFDEIGFSKMSSEDIFSEGKIWIMWWQGYNEAPKLVKKNIDTLTNLFGEEKVQVITKENYKQFVTISTSILKRVEFGQLGITGFSDVIRYNLLAAHGGIWMDSTVVASDLAYDFIKEREGQNFITLKEGQNNYHFISNAKWATWFIGGKKGYPLFQYVAKFYDLLLISQGFTTQAIRLTDFLPAVFLLCMTFQKCEDFSFSSGTFINSF